MAFDLGNAGWQATLVELRAILVEAREADDAERIHVALIDVLERLIDRVQEQDGTTQFLPARQTVPFDRAARHDGPA